MEAASLHKTQDCEREAYRKIVDYADIVLAVYDPASARGDAIDGAMRYAAEQKRPILLIHPDSLAVSVPALSG